MWDPTSKSFYRVFFFVFQSTGPVWDPTKAAPKLASAGAFQSTGPVWDPTLSDIPVNHARRISIHGSRVGPDDDTTVDLADYATISIHGSRVGPDILYARQLCGQYHISIHGSRVGPDLTRRVRGIPRKHFNPRVPCGTRRDLTDAERDAELEFQSTGPVWDPTMSFVMRKTPLNISIHGSRVGPDGASISVKK